MNINDPVGRLWGWASSESIPNPTSARPVPSPWAVQVVQHRNRLIFATGSPLTEDPVADLRDVRLHEVLRVW